MRTVGSTPALLHPTFTPSLRPSPGVTWEVASSLVHLNNPVSVRRTAPHPQQTPCSLPREQAVLWLCVPALRRQRAGPRLSANGGICACALEAASGRGLGKTPSQAPQRGCSNRLGPEVLNVSSSGHPGVCVCLLWEGAGRCCLCDLGKEENQREPRSQHSEAGGRLWESGHGF